MKKVAVGLSPLVLSLLLLTTFFVSLSLSVKPAQAVEPETAVLAPIENQSLSGQKRLFDSRPAFYAYHHAELVEQYPPTPPQITTTISLTGIYPDEFIAEMIDQVHTSTVYSLTGNLSGEWAVTISDSLYTITSRYTYSETQIQKATQYVYENFQDLGIAASYHEWTNSHGTHRNVIGEITGQSRPEDIFMITAHLDDMPGGKLAPGADDNGSGSVGVLVVAQILSQYIWDCTLRFATFTGEEQGLLGSNAYAYDAYQRGDNILGVLNLDMIGYNSQEEPDPVIELHARNATEEAIANLFGEVVSTYNIDLNPEIIVPGIGRSDHVSFWAYGYPAILAIEDLNDFNPYYHSPSDRLENLDLLYFTNFVQAAVGTFAHMGCLQGSYGYLTGTVTSAATGDPVQGASIIATNAFGQDWAAMSDAQGDYQIRLPGGSYAVATQALGYGRNTFSDLQVTSNQTITLYIAMLPNQAYLPLVEQRAP